MASKNLVGLELDQWLLDHNETPEELGPRLGLSGMTLRRVIAGAPVSRSTKWIVARHLGELPSSYTWPIHSPSKAAEELANQQMPGKRQPGGSRAASGSRKATR